jgi:hypothetical protein
MMRPAILCLLLALMACAEPRGWRGNLMGDYQQVATCTAEQLAPHYGAVDTLREDQRVAIVASPAREGAVLYEARLQETAPYRFFAEVRQGGESAAALAAWRAIQACAPGGPDRVHEPISGRELAWFVRD